MIATLTTGHTAILLLLLAIFVFATARRNQAIAKLKAHRFHICYAILNGKIDGTIEAIENLRAHIFGWICNYSEDEHPPFHEIVRVYRTLSNTLNDQMPAEIFTAAVRTAKPIND
jgi:hypothetical protein